MEHRGANGPPIVACYREFVPHPALRSRVRALFSFTSRVEPAPGLRRVTFEVRFAAGDRYQSPLFADGNASIVFDLGTIVHRAGVWCDSAAARGGKVIGPMRRVTPDARAELPAMVGAYLRPAQLSAFANLPSCEVTDRILPVEELWGSTAVELSERLADPNESEAGRVDLLEEALLLLMSQPREKGSAVDISRIADWVTRRGGHASVERLADAAGVSRQHLTRLFRERVGVSPKLYSRLARFQSALGHASAGDRVDWARVAGDLGYADQSHMIAEFREFSSLTPHVLATERWFHPFIERAKAGRVASAPSAPVPPI